jgi:6-phosphogluconolactonase
VRIIRLNNIITGGAQFLAHQIRVGTSSEETFSLALSGGRTPWAIMRQLSEAPGIDWTKVHVYQVDERIAPPSDPDRNLSHIYDAIASRVPAVIHPMPVEDPDLERAAVRYATGLPVALDLVHLGLGADGHTASLVPGDPVLEIVDHDVGITAPYQGRRRMTLTYPSINRARSVVWIVSGPDKTQALQRLLAGDPEIPASAVTSERAAVLTDLQT